MPRMYYHKQDYGYHTRFFFIHSVIFALVNVTIWNRAEDFAGWVTLVWGVLLAFHAWWVYPMNDWDLNHLRHFKRIDLQRDTYTRLEKRLGEDWDLNTSIPQFDRAREQAELRIKIDHIFSYTAYTFLVSPIVWLILLVFYSTFAPPEQLLSHALGVGIVNLFLQVVLRLQLRDKQRKSLKAKRSLMSGVDDQDKSGDATAKIIDIDDFRPYDNDLSRPA